MAKATVHLAESCDAGEWSLVDDALEGLEESWRKAGQPDLAQFLPPPGHALREQVLVELIKVDQECRWRAGEKRLLEAYLAEWPELCSWPSAVRELLEAECLTRASLDAVPTGEELESRFPGIAGQIDLSAIAAQVQREQDSGRGADGAPATRADTSGAMADQTPSARPVAASLTVGQFFGRDGRYEIRELLGQGGMGAVYRAYDTRLEREVALKIPRIDPIAQSAVRERFIRESRAAAKIRHPNICPVFDSDEFDGTLYITMALIEGRSLADWAGGRDVDPREAADVVCKLSQALAAVHSAGIVHRDIKPSNVLVDRAGEPLLMDFGLAHVAAAEQLMHGPDEPSATAPSRTEDVTGESESGCGAGANSRLTKTGSLLGTLQYMSPEQSYGGAVDASSDIFSLGVLFYQLLTGRLPFEGSPRAMLHGIRHDEPPTPSRLRPGLDAELKAVCLQALAKNPADRPPSAQAFADELQRYLDALPRDVAPVGRKRWVTWRRAIAGAAVALLGVGLYLLLGHSPPPPPPAVIPVERVIKTEPADDTGALCGMQISRDNSTIFVAYGDYPAVSRIQTFDAVSGRLLHTVENPDEDKDYCHKGLALSGDERYLYVTNYFRKDISRIDRRENDAWLNARIGGVIPPDRTRSPWATTISISPDKRKLVVLLGCDERTGEGDLDNDQVSIVDVADGRFALDGEVRLDDEPIGQIAFGSDSRFAYVLTFPRKSSAPTLYEIGLTRPYKVTRAARFRGGQLAGVAVCSPLRRVFVSDLGARKLRVVDLDSFKTVSSRELDGHGPGPLALNARGDLLAVLCPESRKVFLTDPADGAVLGRVDGIREGEGGWGLEFSSDSHRLFVWQNVPGHIAVADIRRLQGGIVFASKRAGEGYQIYRLAPGETTPVRLTSNHATDRCPRWSPDGRRIAFVSTEPGTPKICVISCRGGSPTVLKKTDPVIAGRGVILDWAPDGTEIAFIGGDPGQAIRIVDVATGKVRTLVEGELGDGCGFHQTLCWRRIDRQIMVSSQSPDSSWQSGVFLLDPRNGSVRQLISSSGNWDSYVAPMPSPDGKKIAALRPAGEDLPATNVYLADLDGTNRRCLVDAKTKFQRALSWSPDGNHVAYSAVKEGNYHIFSVDVRDGTTVRLTQGDHDDIEPDLSGDMIPCERVADHEP